MDHQLKFTSNDLLKIVLVVGIIYVFMSLYNKQEQLDNVSKNASVKETELPAFLKPVSEKTEVVKPPVVVQSPPVVQSMGTGQVESPADFVPPAASAAQLTTVDLLPKYDDANDFAKQNPVSKLLQEQNFLTSGYHMGINTLVQSNKIPYLDLRSAPAIPKQNLGPFLNSSYEEPAGAKRRQFELGI